MFCPRNSNQQGYIKTDGGNIWYSISGLDKPGVPVIILHGGPGASHYYLEPLVETLARKRPVILYDQLGCGNSDRPGDKAFMTIEYFNRELDEIRRELSLEKIHILGQSWGTMLTVDYMLTRNPVGVLSLIMSSPCLSVFRWHNDCRRLISEMRQEDQNIIVGSESSGSFDSAEYKEAMAAFYKRHLCRLPVWPACITKTFDNMGVEVYEHMWGPSEFTITGTLKNYERAGLLKNIKAPMLFTCGRYDEASPKATEYFHKMSPGSELAIFEDASHMHHIEKPELYLETVNAFLDRHSV